MACEVLIVTGAGTTDINGTYNKVSDTLYTQVEGTYQLQKAEVTEFDLWTFRFIGGEGPPWYRSQTLNEIICPADGGPYIAIAGTAPVPTVSLGESNIDPITARNNKYATATEEGAHRFRRLHALGYV